MADYTIDLCEGGNALASSEEYGSIAANAFDNSGVSGVATAWYAQVWNGISPLWIQYQFTEQKQIRKINLWSFGYSGHEAVDSFTIKASNTGSFTGEEVSIYNGDHDTLNSFSEYTFSNTNSYEYYRVVINSVGPVVAVLNPVVQEIEMMEEIVADVNPDRPDNISGLYTMGSRGNLRGKASEGFIRPSLKQFFTSENFEEITSSQFMEATGGNITTDGDYKVHTFNSTGIFNITTLGIIGTVEYLIVAGGGGGGGQCGGGGGAGGLLTTSNDIVTKTSYNITVGAGGTAGVGQAAHGGIGGNSSFNSVIATGGGGGGAYNSGQKAGDGGSGGGCGYTSAYGKGYGIVGQGHDGGLSDIIATGAGGGGAGTTGYNSTYAGNGSGPGGLGLSSDISGNTIWYAGGGGGGTNSGGSASAGGSAVGGTGGFNRTDNATPGMDYRGGGGGGGANVDANGKSGGSGVVVIRYRFQ